MNIKSLLSDKNNCIDTTWSLINLLAAKITHTTISEELNAHPESGSILAISDVLHKYGIRNTALRITPNELNTNQPPFIAQISDPTDGNNYFTVIRSVSDDHIDYLDPLSLKWKSVKPNLFIPNWSGIVLTVQQTVNAGEKDYQEKRKKELLKLSAFYAVILLLPVIWIFTCIYSLFLDGTAAIPDIILTGILMAGTIAGALLFLFEVDSYNPLIKKICAPTIKMNCNAILTSKASKIAGISWSVIGFTYFMGGILLLLIKGINNTGVISMLSLFNVMALPYIIFSIYYQWRIAKQWCVLCLSIQFILFSQFIWSMTSHSLVLTKITAITLQDLVSASICYLVTFIFFNEYLSLKKSKKEWSIKRKDLNKLRGNSDVLFSLLNNERSLTELPHGLGMTLGSTKPAHTLIKICNPYCAPCASAHVAIEELLTLTPDLQVQIIFTTTNSEEDFRFSITNHLLAIAELGDETILRKAMDDWYNAEKKDYKTFANKYPLNNDINSHSKKIEAMSDWCTRSELHLTPMLFLNGSQLPEIFSLDDLKYSLQN